MDREIEPGLDRGDQNISKVASNDHRWILGFALLVIGGILLVQNLVGWQIDHWWFILLIIPSIGSFATAYRRYHIPDKSQRSSVIRPIVIGMFFLLSAIVLSCNLGGQMILPLLFIFMGMIAFVWILSR
jgi:hypothetical protein